MRTLLAVALCVLPFLLGACASKPKLIPEVESAALASDGVSIRYRIAGREKPEPIVVFVHGFGGDASIWDEQIEHVSKKHRVAALDLPGHGKSGTDRMTQWTMEAFGDDVRAVCDEIGAEKIILVGHSMGGPVVLEAARLMPDRVVSLILVETFHDVEKRMPEDQLKQLQADWKSDYKTNVSRMAREHLFTPDADKQIVESVVARMQMLRPDIASSMMGSMFRYDIAKHMEGVAVPMHFINASGLGPTDIEALRRHSKNVDLVQIEHVGHFPMLEAPAEFDKALDAALDDEPEKRAPKE